MAYLQPFAITVNNSANSTACVGNSEVWVGYACMCENYNGDGTDCSNLGQEYGEPIKEYQCIYDNGGVDEWENDYTGTCHINGQGNNIFEVEVQGLCPCDSQPVDGECILYEATVEYSCGCDPITCGSGLTYLEEDGPGGGVYDCPSISGDASYYNGCGAYSLSCGNDCPTYFECSPAEAGSCICATDCGAQNWNCGDHPCGYTYGQCGTLGECEECIDHQPVSYEPTWTMTLQPPSTYELGCNTEYGDMNCDFNISFSHQYISTDVSIGYCFNTCDNPNWILENIDIGSVCNSGGTYIQSLNLSEINDIGSYYIIIRDNTAVVGDLISSQINIQNNTVPGCRDECADNYCEECTTEIGAGHGGSCTYSGCTDELGAQYFCRTNGGCENSHPCLEIHSYTFNDIVETCECTFYPNPLISVPPGVINEGTSLNIWAYESDIFLVTDGGPYTNGTCEYVDETITYDWNLSVIGNITEGETDPSNTWSDVDQISIDIPYFDDGAGILNIDLTVTNSYHSVTLDDYQIGISDVDIIGAQISDFPAIYIPGGNQWIYIPCTLPVGDYNEYTLGDILSVSFYDSDPTGIDNPVPNNTLWTVGDLMSTRICIDIGCDFNQIPPTDAIIGGSMYIGSDTWLGTAPLQPGAAYFIQTLNSGWLRWTIPA